MDIPLSDPLVVLVLWKISKVDCAYLDAVNNNFTHFCSCLFLSLILNIASVGIVMTVLHSITGVGCVGWFLSCVLS